MILGLIFWAIGMVYISASSWSDVIAKRGFQPHDVLLIAGMTIPIVMVIYALVFGFRL